MSGNSNQEIVLGDQDIAYPIRIGNLYNPAVLTTTTPQTLATGAPGYYITELGYQCDQLATLAVAATINIIFSDSSFGTIANFILFLPAAVGPKTAPATIRQVNPGPFVWSNKVANSTLTVALDTALTAGSVRAFIRWGRTNYLG